MTEETKQLLSKEINALLSEVITEKVINYPTIEVSRFLVFLKTIRWYGIASTTELKDIWLKIRNDVSVTDFIVDLTIDFQIKLKLNYDMDIDDISMLVGAAIDSMKREDSTNRLNVTDEDFIERSIPTGITSMFQKYPWITVCYMLSRLDLKPWVESIQKYNEAPKQTTS